VPVGAPYSVASPTGLSNTEPTPYELYEFHPRVLSVSGR